MQGFITFPSSGGATQLDVDTLNERLRSNGAIRHRHALRPDEAHACIFTFDDVIVDTRAVQRAAWQRLAAEEELPFPQGQAERQLVRHPARARHHRGRTAVDGFPAAG